MISPSALHLSLELSRETTRFQRCSRARCHGNTRVARLARLCAPKRRSGQSGPAAPRADDSRPPERRETAVYGQYALHQHHFGRRAGADARQPGHRAPDQEPGPLECAGDGGPGEQGRRRHRRPHLDLRLGGDALRGGLQSLLPRQRHRAGRRRGLLPGACRSRHLRARVSRRADRRDAPRELPPRAEGRRRPLVLPASLADAGLLGIPHRLDGARSDHGHLPFPVHPLHGGPRADAEVGRQGLGVSRRRRDRRAGNARRDHAAGAREARQPDLRHQLQPAAAGRPGPR